MVHERKIAGEPAAGLDDPRGSDSVKDDPYLDVLATILELQDPSSVSSNAPWVYTTWSCT